MEARLDRIEQHILSLAGVTGELAREVRSLVQGLATDRALFRETLRDLSGFVAAVGIEMGQLTRQLQRLGETTETGFAQMQMLAAENNRQIAENNRQIMENNRLVVENNVAIRRLLDILARGRGDGQGPPQ
jgi:hypothetical protein